MKDDLRAKAQKRISNQQIQLEGLSPEEITRIAQELQIHQVELEIQNQELQRIFQDLETSRSHFYRLFHQAPVGYLVLDENAVMKQVNQNFAEMIGQETEHLIGKNFQNCLTPEDRGRFLAIYRAFFKDPRQKKYEFNVISKNQRQFPVQIQGALIDLSPQSSQSVTQLLVTITDIHLIKQAQEISKLNEARLQSLLRITQYTPKNLQDLLDYSLEEAILLTHSKFGYIYFYDEDTRQFQLNSWSKDAMRGCDVVEPQTTYQLEKTGFWGEVVRQRKPILNNTFQAANPLKQGLPTGHVKLYKFLSIPVFHRNKIVAVVGVANKEKDYEEADIRQLQLLMDSVWKLVEQKRVEDKLKEQEEQFVNLFSNMAEGVALHELVYDREGFPCDYRVLNINPGYEKILNLQKADVINKLATDIYQTSQPPLFKRYLQVIKLGQPDHIETYFPPLKKHFEISVVPWGMDRFATIFSDITVRKQLELDREKMINQLEEKNTELERFTYTVSHDLKSPLITIKGFLDIVKEDLAEKNFTQMEEDLERISSAADRMKALLDNLLELSRVGKTNNAHEWVDLNELIHETQEILYSALKEKQIHLEVPNDLPNIYGDRARLTEVFQNLIENAIKYTGHQPHPTISIHAETHENNVEVCIKDNGIGIDPAYHKKIFGLFEKLDPRSEGNGVGLALVKRIIEHHGGEIWVTSAGMGEGSQFCFRIPNQGGESE